jgi:hypothetical protein
MAKSLTRQLNRVPSQAVLELIDFFRSSILESVTRPPPYRADDYARQDDGLIEIGSMATIGTSFRQPKWFASAVMLPRIEPFLLFSSPAPIVWATVLAIAPGRTPAASMLAINSLQSPAPVPRFGATSIR